MEMKFDVPPAIWQKFEQMSGDIARDRTEVFIEIVEKAHAEFEAAKTEAEAVVKEAEGEVAP